MTVSVFSATGWLTMKVALCAARLDPSGGWSLSESGDMMRINVHESSLAWFIWDIL